MRWIGPVSVFALAAVVSFVVLLGLIPGIIMDRAMANLESRGVPLHAFVLSPRITPESQTVVRPSPDLAYSICRYDLSDPAAVLTVTAGAYADYSSISFFDARTVNFATVRPPRGQQGTVRLLSPSAAGNGDAIIAPTTRGLVLIRRLAPSLDDYQRVGRTSSRDRCELSANPA